MPEIINKLNVSASPHIKSPKTTTKIMLDVIIALVPSLIASVVIFGFRALAVTCVCVAVCVLSEYVSRKVMKRDNTISDLSAVVTGILLAFNLPSTIPLWIAAIGSVVSIVVIKQFFGGIGQNFINPALGGRIILLTSFPSQMATWEKPLSWMTDAQTTATPLAGMYDSAGNFTKENLPGLFDMFIGLRGGCLGEVCAAAILLGFIYLLARKIISPIIPVCFVASTALFMLVAGKFNVEFLAYQLLSGGLLLGAVFMATDYTTSPISKKGKVIYGIGCGLLTALIRFYSNLPEGVSFSILIMNILTPHIESLTRPRPFGTTKAKAKEGEAK